MVKKADLLPYRRYVVRYWTDEPGKGRVTRDATLNGQVPRRGGMLGYPVISYVRQSDGNLHVISAELVKDVIIEQGDRYDQWHKVGAIRTEDIE